MLTVNNITKKFNVGTSSEHTALDSVSLSVNDGDFITIIGSNGAGKTTLFNAISGTFYIDSGSIILDGKDITMVPEYKRASSIGRLFQNPSLGSAPNMSIEENLALASGKGGWLGHIKKSDRKELAERLSVLGMGLENKMNTPVGLLSGGQRQALALLMATYNPPKLLLLDEHTAALDPTTAVKVLELTKKIVEENSLTCLMITHNMQSALDLGNRTLMMHSGKIMFDLSGDERENMTVSSLLEKFRNSSGRDFDNDRVLLSRE